MKNVKKNNIKKKASDTQEAFFYSSASSIHPTAHIEDSVQLGVGVTIGPFCCVTGNVIIGDHTTLYGHVTVGGPAQVLSVEKSLGTIMIGSNCHIREFVSIHAPRTESGSTAIGNNCYIMSYSHIAHDVQLGNHVILTNNSSLGGHTIVEDHVRIMAFGATHQFCRIGTHAALAPYSGTRQDLPPYGLYSGQPAQFAGLNRVGLQRATIPQSSIEHLRAVARLFYQKNMSLSTLEKSIEKNQAWNNDQYIKEFISFIHTSIHHGRGISRRTLQQGRSLPSLN